MSRTAFYCDNRACNRRLATISPEGRFRIEPGVEFDLHLSYLHLRLRCPCGTVSSFGRQRKAYALRSAGWEAA